MTRLDSELEELANRIRGISTRAQAALFWACSAALTDGFLAWSDRRGGGSESLLRAGQSAAYNFAAFGFEPPDAATLLSEMEAGTPAGDSPDEFSSSTAQDCWICADVGIRVWVIRAYDAAPAVEYALEPILGAVSEDLFGFTQVGSGPDEEGQIERLLQDSRVASAFEFMRWAIGFVGSEPDEEALRELRLRSAVLSP
jgi:hypothetical protein